MCIKIFIVVFNKENKSRIKRTLWFFIKSLPLQNYHSFHHSIFPARMSLILIIIFSCIFSVYCKEQCQTVTLDYKNLTDFESIKVTFVSKVIHRFSSNNSLIFDVGFIMRHRTNQHTCFYKKHQMYYTMDSDGNHLHHPLNNTSFAVFDYSKGNKVINALMCSNEKILWDSQEIIYTALYRYVTGFLSCEVDPSFSNKAIHTQDIYTDIENKQIDHYMRYTLEVQQTPSDDEWETVKNSVYPAESCETVLTQIKKCKRIREKFPNNLTKESKMFQAYALVLLSTFILLVRILMYDLLESCKKV